MTQQRITLKIGKITVKGPTSRRRLEAALHRELSTILHGQGITDQIGQSRFIECRSTSVSLPAKSGDASLGPRIANAVIGVLTS